MSTIQERLAPFDWRQLEKDTEYRVPPRVVSELSIKWLDELLEIYCDDYDDTYDLPVWQTIRVPKYNSSHRTRVSVSKKKETK